MSDDRRQAILDAAIHVMAAQGLSAPTATIAKQAGVANGSLFTYFATKAELWNALYVELKTEMADASGRSFDAAADPKVTLELALAGWLNWAVEHPERRRALGLLGTSDEITQESLRAGHTAMAPFAQLIERCRANGPMRDVSLGFVTALMTATAEATIDFIQNDPANADLHARTGFEALWRMIA
ncbi:MAG: TetR/AcrR family transcriptional regulator [Devosia sp.]|nr:TetR/AcrR family transcriptional regulator [Devosia sp.]